MPSRYNGSRSDDEHEHGGTRTCKGCGGKADAADGSQHPAGWLGLTAFTPKHIGTGSGKGYVWVGLYCSVACLARDLMNLRYQEELAQQAFEPVRAGPPPRSCRPSPRRQGRPPMTQPPQSWQQQQQQQYGPIGQGPAQPYDFTQVYQGHQAPDVAVVNSMTTVQAFRWYNEHGYIALPATQL